MKRHLTNAVFGVLDYVTYPAVLLLASPLLLREIGVERYGIWMLAGAITMTGGVAASGLGDANIRTIAEKGTAKDYTGAGRNIENALGTHIVLGVAVAAVTWMLCPWIAARSAGNLYVECLWSLRLSCVLILIRAIETVWVSTLRGASLYGTAFSVTGSCRLMSLAAAVVLPCWTKSVAAIVAAWVLICACGLVVQSWQVKHALDIKRIRPRLEWSILGPLLAFGMFTWIQAVAGLLFTQVDRVMVGMLFGAAEVAAYAICAQLTQPIFGIAAAGLHFLLPYVASRERNEDIRAGLLRAFAANAAFVGAGVAALLMCGRPILMLIGGKQMAGSAPHLLPLLAYATALAAMSVTGCYAMLALGRVREVALFTVAGGVLGTLAVLPLARAFGIEGIVYARMLYGIVILMIYGPLLLHFAQKARLTRRAEPSWEDA